MAERESILVASVGDADAQAARIVAALEAERVEDAPQIEFRNLRALGGPNSLIALCSHWQTWIGLLVGLFGRKIVEDVISGIATDEAKKAWKYFRERGKKSSSMEVVLKV